MKTCALDINRVIEMRWPEIKPISGNCILPPFPTGLFPSFYKDMIEMVTKVNQVDPALPASIFLSILSMSLAKKVKVNLKTHVEPVNLYICSISESGERKSSTMNIFVDPISKYQSEKRKGNNDITYFVNDVTTEKLGDLMEQNDERMAIISTEGGIFNIISGLYSDSGFNMDIYQQSYTGDFCETHRLSRKGVSLENPCLTIGVTVQPFVLEDIKNNRKFRGVGFLGRFLYSMNESKAGFRSRQYDTIPDEYRELYHKKIQELMDIPLGDNLLEMSEGAMEFWDFYYNKVELEMREGNSLSSIKDWGSKFAGTVARIAGLLHIAEYGTAGFKKSISSKTVLYATIIGDYFKEHALKVFDIIGEDPAIFAAGKILEYIQVIKPKTFKVRDVIRHKNALSNNREVETGLQVLIERGYIRKIVKTSTNEKGRPESPEYEINPILLA